jgi:TIR domain
MATLHEYFLKDTSRDLAIERKWTLSNGESGKQLPGEIVAKLCLNFDANAKFVAFYIPDIAGVEFPEPLVLNQIGPMLDWPATDVGVQSGMGEDRVDGKELIFTGRVFIYSERPPAPELKARLLAEAREKGHFVIHRSSEYMNYRNQFERPRAFICHDSRDKKEVAEPLAIQLEKLMVPVWYDDFTLKIGDSLRASIEAGLKECNKCILVLTPNFLKNGGWSKREYDSIFTRELVEKQNVILPVWSGVSSKDVYEYSPILADRVAADWSLGTEEVARRLFRSLDSI